MHASFIYYYYYFARILTLQVLNDDAHQNLLMKFLILRLRCSHLYLQLVLFSYLHLLIHYLPHY
jgi:hypothetical protein